MNKKHVILDFIKIKFKIQLYIKFNVKNKSYLAKQ
jgi:hypothetical protein